MGADMSAICCNDRLLKRGEQQANGDAVQRFFLPNEEEDHHNDGGGAGGGEWLLLNHPLRCNTAKDPFHIPSILSLNLFGATLAVHVPQQYPTINAALHASRPGSCIVVSSGVYRESLVIRHTVQIVGRSSKIHRSITHDTNNNNNVRGIDVDNNGGDVCVTIQSPASQSTLTAVGARTLVQLSNVCILAPKDTGRGAMDYAVDLDSATAFFDRCKIRGGHWGVLAHGIARFVARSTLVVDARDHGIFVKDTSQLWLEDCDVSGHGQSGVNVHDKSCHAVLSQCRVRLCKANGVFAYGGAMLRIRDCSISSNGHAGVCVCDLGSHAEVLQNRINGNGLQGVYVWDGGSANVASNDLTGNGHWALNVGAESKGSVTSVDNVE